LIVFSLHQESLKLILVDEPLPEVVLSQRLCWSLWSVRELLTSFICGDQFCYIIDYCWPIEKLLKDFNDHCSSTYVASTDSCGNFWEELLAFGLADAAKEGTWDEGLVQIVVKYLIHLGSLLHSDVLYGIVWLAIMAEVCHYGCMTVFPLYYVDETWALAQLFWLRHLPVLEKNTSAGIGVLRAVAFAKSSSSVFLFLLMYYMVKPLN
jgi:hypothetical protein